MTALSRIRNGYAPGTMDAIFLAQDIDELNAKWHSKHATLAVLLADSAEFEIEAKRIGVQEMIAKILLQRGQILQSHQQYQESLVALTEANEILGSIRQQDLKVMIYAALAESHSHLQAWIAVLNICKQGIPLVECYRYQVSSQYLQSSYLRSRIGLYAHGVRAAYELGSYDLMLEWAELSKCRSVLRHQDRSASTEEEQRIERQFLNVCRQIDEVRVTGNETDLDLLLIKRRTLWDHLLIQRNQSKSVEELPYFDLAAVQAELASDEVILYYYWLDVQTLLIVIIENNQQKAILRSLTIAEQQSLVKYAEIVLESLSPELPEYLVYIDKAKAFASLLLPVEMTEIVQNKHRLLISPHRLLHALPFQALPWDDEHPYLIQRFAITYIPNLSTLLLVYRQPNKRSLLALGICDYAQHGSKYPALEEAKQEVTELETLYVRQGFNVKTLLNAKADEKQLHQLEQTGELANFSCLHISTHGHNVNSDTPMESYLLLYDSVLDGLEIANWQLNAELTVLSACCSGQRPFRGRGMDELPGDDLFGLQAAFFAAGSRRVLGSFWPVDATVAHTIIMAFHRFWVTGQTPEMALQRAIVEYIDNAGLRLRKSYYWASFFLSAVGRSHS